MDVPLHEQPHAVSRCSRSREIICTVCCGCFVCKEVTIVAINSLAIETQRNHKLCACIVNCMKTMRLQLLHLYVRKYTKLQVC